MAVKFFLCNEIRKIKPSCNAEKNENLRERIVQIFGYQKIKQKLNLDNCYTSFNALVPKLLRAVTQIMVADYALDINLNISQ